MTLLDFARGPAFQWAVAIFVFGTVWRVVGAVLILRRKDLSEPRSKALARGGFRTILTRSLPPHQLEKNIRFQHITGYAWHIGFFITILFLEQHIAFFKTVFGISWPGVPNDLVVVAAAITLALLIALLIRRIMHPVLRLISSADDYISILVTLLPLVTGLMAYAHLGARYETLLALHILSVSLLLVWFPFSKLMHACFAFPSRYQIGAFFQRKGVQA